MQVAYLSFVCVSSLYLPRCGTLHFLLVSLIYVRLFYFFFVDLRRFLVQYLLRHVGFGTYLQREVLELYVSEYTFYLT